MRNPKNRVVFNHEILPDVVFNHVENGRRTDILEPLEKNIEVAAAAAAAAAASASAAALC